MVRMMTQGYAVNFLHLCLVKSIILTESANTHLLEQQSKDFLESVSPLLWVLVAAAS